MQALELLLTRSSMPRLIEPGPSKQQLDLLLQAASRAPDHVALTPYQFAIFADSARQQLGEIFRQAAERRNKSAEEQLAASQLPLRAPTVIAVSMVYQPHDKVPRDEQFASAACATLLLQQAAFAQNLGAIWRTGWFAEDNWVKEQLGCGDDDAIVGFLYVGTPAVPTPIKPMKDIANNIKHW
ncbi:nitroreductase [Pseudidiomarina aestuarii]|uniref:Putative NAD(P)H nitroreductase n=1 Tax=Pseudidiomarina aestuarii TaxID=624146 RepID=A0A7Z6ZTJ1_9GAMM|nr:nitroreductase family protein [Pseudidiomarina aestuarii]RUO41127.1 nitroreductase [Pseudidiomarina aestuarii]